MDIKLHLKELIDDDNNLKIELLSNGISNINYKISSEKDKNRKYVLTIFPNKENWWKIDKEIYLDKLLNINGIKTTKILKSGNIQNSKYKSKYLLKEFIPNVDFYYYLKITDEISSEDFSNFFLDLGSTLKKIHTISLNGFGMIKIKTNSENLCTAYTSFNNWVDFTDYEMESKVRICKNLDRKSKIGSLSSTEIIKIFELSHKFYNTYRVSLKNVNKSKLIHNDILFENLIIFKEKEFRASLNAIIDNEWMSAGDPLIDLVQLENAIYFNSRKTEIKKYWSFFINAYTENEKLIIDENFKKKRLVYHMMRSLFYLIEVFGMNRNKQIVLSTEFIKNIQNNYIFVKKIINRERLDLNLIYPVYL
jgi:hypothetical protein